MLIRSLAVAFTAALFACTTPTSTVAGSDHSAETNGNGGNKSNSSTSGKTANTGSTSATDGTWDITASGLAPSSITFNGSKISGKIALDNFDDSVTDCISQAESITFSFTVSGNKLTGSSQTLQKYADSSCGDAPTVDSTITAERSKTPAAGAKTFLEGDWQVTVDDGDPLSINVAGLVLKMFANENGDSENSDDPLVMNISGDKASASGANMTFSAKRR